VNDHVLSRRRRRWLVYAGTNPSGACYAFDTKERDHPLELQTAGHNVWAGPSVAVASSMWARDTRTFMPSTPAPAPNLWSFSAGTPIVNTPRVVNGVVYLGAGALYALSASDGGRSGPDWRPRGRDGLAGVSGGKVFVGVYNPGVRAHPISMPSTRGLRRCLLQSTLVRGNRPAAARPGELDGIQSSAAVANGSVYVGAPTASSTRSIPRMGPFAGRVRRTARKPRRSIPTRTPIASSSRWRMASSTSRASTAISYDTPRPGCATATCPGCLPPVSTVDRAMAFVSNCWDTTSSSPVVVNGVIYVGGCTQTYTDALYAFTVLPCAPEVRRPAASITRSRPARILDTRTSHALTNVETRRLQVEGQGGIPSGGASAAILNVNGHGYVGGELPGALSTGASRPTASNLQLGRPAGPWPTWSRLRSGRTVREPLQCRRHRRRRGRRRGLGPGGHEHGGLTGRT